MKSSSSLVAGSSDLWQWGYGSFPEHGESRLMHSSNAGIAEGTAYPCPGNVAEMHTMVITHSRRESRHDHHTKKKDSIRCKAHSVKNHEVHLDRTNSKRQIGFGTGPFACSGAQLARRIAAIGWRTLFSSFPSLH